MCQDTKLNYVCPPKILAPLVDSKFDVQLDCRSAKRKWKINLPANQKGYDNSETTVGKLLVRRIQTCPYYFWLDIILKVILNNFQNNA